MNKIVYVYSALLKGLEENGKILNNKESEDWSKKRAETTLERLNENKDRINAMLEEKGLLKEVIQKATQKQQQRG